MSLNYKKLTPIEHVLKRPNVYIGNVTPETAELFLYNETSTLFEKKMVSFVPGLLKLFDEVLSNAIDHSKRTLKVPVTEIKVKISEGVISVYNNGTGIPLELNSENVYVPEMIFSELMTGSNYDDDSERYLVGTNGLGVKLAGIFSDYFKITCVTENKKYVQIFKDNLRFKSKPKITECKGKVLDSVNIEFKINTPYFGCEFPTDILISKAILSSCVLKDLKKYSVNGSSYKCKDLKVFYKKYFNIGNGNVNSNVVYIKSNDWEILLSPSCTKKEQISFVNGEQTLLGGKHVKYIFDTLTTGINKKYKTVNVTSSEISDVCSLFLIAEINQPSFDSQTKDYLNTPPSKFGKTPVLSDTFIKQFIASDMYSAILERQSQKQTAKLSKMDGKKKNKISGIPKLDDANFAGTKKSTNCTLYLTEGDSAKTFVISGFSVIGRDFNGVFPLRGKMLNAREATKKQLLENAEIANIKKIIGLEQNKVYTDTSSLRYSKICIVADQDLDGFHCLSLIFNMIHFFWPELLKLGFISYMNTALVKGTNVSGKRISFYSEKEYQKFTGKLKDVKYFKGLGSSTKIEAQESFKNPNLVKLNWSEACEKAILLAFQKSCIPDRKEWLTKYNVLEEPEERADTFDTFVNNKLVQFSSYDCVRSIPDLVDGLKPSQRKILFVVLKRNITSEIKVAQLGASVSEQTKYHHGENSLFGAIVNMAQDFCGSNNMNLLEPCGQFGSRLLSGSDSASPRYIFTRMNENTKYLFPRSDLGILDYKIEEGVQIEPIRFYPTLPVVLINGTQGIGSGYSTFVPCFNPEDIKVAIKCILNGTEPKKLIPWYKNFKGSIVPKGTNFEMTCEFQVKDDTIVITEIPVGTSITQFKELLESIESIVILKNNSTENSVYFEIKCTGSVNHITDLKVKLKLEKKISCDNMHLFHNGKLRKFDTPLDILKTFTADRIEFLKRKKEFDLKVLAESLEETEYFIRFISEIISEKIIVYKKTKKETTTLLLSHNYPEHIIPRLMSSNMYSFSEESILEYNQKKLKLEKELQVLKNNTPKDLFLASI